MSVLDSYTPQKGDRVRVKASDFKDGEGEVVDIQFSSYFGDYWYIVDLEGRVRNTGFRNYELEKI